ncbi:MAG: suppressor of fused domain protein [Planctomycetes bacterium]|jgi:hypothetical protein|nr:suppressor of fused domain protein [Planctomycetota bacterium]
MLEWLFGKRKRLSPEEIERREIEAYERKSEYMRKVLGEEHGTVMHAIIPYDAGGSLDLYYYPHCKGGTAVATKELVHFDFRGPSNDAFDAYEIVMCTKRPLDLDSVKNPEKPEGSFARAHDGINRVLNLVARYSAGAKLNPFETVEFPADMEHVGGKCLILHDLSKPLKDETTGGRSFGLMLIMEIHRSEMEYAMRQRGQALIALLQEHGVYPFSDLDREPVV